MSDTPPKQRRNRARKPAWSFSGMSDEQWRASPEHVRWAQTAPEYRDVLSVLNNAARAISMELTPGLSEGEHLGEARGAFKLFEVALSLANGVTPPNSPMGEPDYPPEN